jgi:hypothetical protein
MQQSDALRPPYASLLDALAEALEPVVAEVVADVRGPDEDPAAVMALVRPAVERLVAILAAGPEPTESDLARLRLEGGETARTGNPVAGPIDRYLSAGWALWDAATRRPAVEPSALASLGSALLRTGDAAAAAIAEGYGEAERELAGQAASARRAFVDDLLGLAPGDAVAMARLTRRASTLGIPASIAWQPTVAALDAELEDGGPEASRVERALARPERALAGSIVVGPIVAARHGRLVILQPLDRRPPVDPAPILGALAGGDGWVAVRGGMAEGLAAVAGAVDDAFAGLDVASRTGARGRIVESADLALERALLADEATLREAVDRELGPLRDAPRNGAALVDTLRAWLDERQNLQATARRLRVAPRTVAYRLVRVERLTGRRLDGPAIRRLATALVADDLLGRS